MKRTERKRAGRNPLTKVTVRRATREKLDEIRRARRWTFVETVDVLADEYRQRHATELQLAS